MKKLLSAITIFTLSITLGWSQSAPPAVKNAARNSWSFVITPQTTKHSLDSLKMAWAKESIDLNFTKLKYNTSGKLEQVKGSVAIKANGHYATATFNSESLESFTIKVDDGQGVYVNGK